VLATVAFEMNFVGATSPRYVIVPATESAPPVGVGVGVLVAVFVAVGVDVKVAVAVGVFVAVLVGVSVGVFVGEFVCVEVAVGVLPQPLRVLGSPGVRTPQAGKFALKGAV
jgi:hypothetical protein